MAQFEKPLVKDKWSASILTKKNLKNWFFSIFFQINHTFSVWNWIVCEKCFLSRYCMWKSFKNYKIWNFHPLLSGKGQNQLALMAAFRETWILSQNMNFEPKYEFWAKIGSWAKIDTGGLWSHPPVLARHLDVSLIRVKQFDLQQL